MPSISSHSKPRMRHLKCFVLITLWCITKHLRSLVHKFEIFIKIHWICYIKSWQIWKKNNRINIILHNLPELGRDPLSIKDIRKWQNLHFRPSKQYDPWFAGKAMQSFPSAATPRIPTLPMRIFCRLFVRTSCQKITNHTSHQSVVQFFVVYLLWVSIFVGANLVGSDMTKKINTDVFHQYWLRILNYCCELWC